MTPLVPPGYAYGRDIVEVSSAAAHQMPLIIKGLFTRKCVKMNFEKE